MTWILVGVFGAIGALTRYGVSGVVQRWWRTTYPMGTTVVNVSGALGAGVLVGLATTNTLPDAALVAVAVGFLGGYTTFSTWMVETVLGAEADPRVATRGTAVRLLVPLVVGVIAAAVGYAVGSRL